MDFWQGFAVITAVHLLAAAHARLTAEATVGGDEEVHGVAPLRVLREHAATAVLDVVRMRADGQDVHGLRRGQLGLTGPGIAAAEDGQARIAVRQ